MKNHLVLSLMLASPLLLGACSFHGAVVEEIVNCILETRERVR